VRGEGGSHLLIRGKETKIGEGKGTEPFPKVRLSKDRMPVEPLPLPDGRGKR